MNYFALSVVVLQFLASAQYVRQGLWLEAGLWALYGLANLLMIAIAMKRLTT